VLEGGDPLQTTEKHYASTTLSELDLARLRHAEFYSVMDRRPDADGKGGREYQGGEVWKLDLGAELNHLLYLADELARTATSIYNDDLLNGDMAKVLRSVVDRVVEFEELDWDQTTYAI